MWLRELQKARAGMPRKLQTSDRRILVPPRLASGDADPLVKLLWDLVDVWDPHVNDILRKHGVEFEHDDGSHIVPGS